MIEKVLQYPVLFMLLYDCINSYLISKYLLVFEYIHNTMKSTRVTFTNFIELNERSQANSIQIIFPN